MNKQEAIELFKNNTYRLFGSENEGVPLEIAIGTVQLIDGPAKVIVPKFVAEWIEEKKKSGIDLHKSMAYEVKADVFRYIMDNSETYVRAWLDGYEVEQEKEYIVTDGNKLYLKEFDELNAVIIIDDVLGATDYAKRYSDLNEAQKAAAELGWKVVEVE